MSSPQATNYDTWHVILRGLVCVCRPGCTREAWGDASRCTDTCEACRIMSGQPYEAPPKTTK